MNADAGPGDGTRLPPPDGAKALVAVAVVFVLGLLIGFALGLAV